MFHEGVFAMRVCFKKILLGVSMFAFLPTFGLSVQAFPSHENYRTQGGATPHGFVDLFGNIFVPESINNIIRKITPAGIVSILAGQSGVSGSQDGAAFAASFNNPLDTTVDSAGNVYVADEENNVIRKITPAGVVSTLAGQASVNGGSQDGTGAAASFGGPTGLAVDTTGNVYVADFFNYTIRKITPAGVVTTLAGQPGVYGSQDGAGTSARFFRPESVAVDLIGNVYVADSGNATIRKITSAGVVTTLAGQAGVFGSLDGIGSAARFSGARGIGVDSSGNVYVADSFNYTIRKITPTGVVSTLAGQAGVFGSQDGTGAAARFHEPVRIAVDSSGNVYVVDFNSIRKITPAGVVTTLLGHL
jgi:hypothetical protein